MRLPKIALVYSDRERPDTTGGHVLRAFQRLTDTVHLHPSDLATVTARDADLFLCVDDDTEFAWPERLHPAAYWAIDTHLDYASRLRRAMPFDRVFCAQKSGAERMQREALHATWLPLACDPEFHGKCDVDRTLDLCLIGSVLPGRPRADLVALLQSHFPRMFAGPHSFDALGQAYSRAHIGFNCTLQGDLNMRAFEVLCAGSLLLTDPMDGMEALFQEGDHLVTYAGPEDLCAQAHHYLEATQERERIAETGRNEVLDKHTYTHRVIEILKAFDLWKSGKPGRSRQRRRTGGRTEEHELRSPHASSLADATTELAAPNAAHTSEPQIIRTGEIEPYGQRPEVADLVPKGAMCVLDIGCSTGGLGELLKERARRIGNPEPIVVGVEAVARLAAAAQARLDTAIVGDIELLLRDHPEQLLAPLRSAAETTTQPDKLSTSQTKSAGQSSRPSASQSPQQPLFDCVIFADSLEHLRDPEATLRSLRPLLATDATVVLSVPNVRHHEVFQKLAEGRWQYEEAGLLDRTHLRFFTRRDLEQTLFRSGYDVRTIVPKFTPDHPRWVALGRPTSLSFGNVTLTDLPPDEAEEFFTYQWLVTATSRQVVDYGLTSIIILTRNQIGYTQACVHSIRLHTTEPYELIFVDNGSTDGTPDYLKSLANVVVIRNEVNAGFPKGCNQGIAAARGQNILLLNNDTLVADGWLTRLLQALYSAPDVGVVGPRSHYASGQPMLYTSPPQPPYVDTFAWEMARSNEGRRIPVANISGFCLLVRRSVLDIIGSLDEQYGVGLFEDLVQSLLASR